MKGEIQLKGLRSLVRVILTDNQLNEYLLDEAYPLITPSIHPQGGITSIRSGCHETCVLPNIRPKTIQIELISASMTISAFDVISSPATASSSTVGRQHKERYPSGARKGDPRQLNRQIRAAGLRWVAGPTPISKLSYAEKKKLFRGQVVPNLQGFEYYKGGIFELPGSMDVSPLASPQTGSAMVPRSIGDPDMEQITQLAPGFSAGSSCNIAVAFRPAAANTRTGSITVSDSDPATPHVVKLSGTGTIVKLSTKSLSLGTTVLGYKSAAKQILLTNVGKTYLTISAVTISGATAIDDRFHPEASVYVLMRILAQSQGCLLVEIAC